MLTVTIGTWTATYVMVATTAPPAYDGFGTLEIASYLDLPKPAQGRRYVAVQRQHLTWQTQRYGSGLHAAIVRDKAAMDGLLQRTFVTRLTATQEDPSHA